MLKHWRTDQRRKQFSHSWVRTVGKTRSGNEVFQLVFAVLDGATFLLGFFSVRSWNSIDVLSTVVVAVEYLQLRGLVVSIKKRSSPSYSIHYCSGDLFNLIYFVLIPSFCCQLRQVTIIYVAHVDRRSVHRYPIMHKSKKQPKIPKLKTTCICMYCLIICMNSQPYYYRKASVYSCGANGERCQTNLENTEHSAEFFEVLNVIPNCSKWSKYTPP